MNTKKLKKLEIDVSEKHHKMFDKSLKYQMKFDAINYNATGLILNLLKIYYKTKNTKLQKDVWDYYKIKYPIILEYEEAGIRLTYHRITRKIISVKEENANNDMD